MLSRTNSCTTDVPIARVDAQDPEQAQPLREYLEQHGVAVVLGREPALPETYHIICGDSAFVKEKLEQRRNASVLPFIVLFLSPGQTVVPTDFAGVNAKIAATTGSYLSLREMDPIFAHFFTGDAPVLVVEGTRNTAGRGARSEGSAARARQPSQGCGSGGALPWRTRRVAALGVVLLLLAPYLWYVVSVGMILVLQWYAISAMAKGTVSRVPIAAAASAFWIGQGRGALAAIGLSASIVGARSTIRTHERLLSIAHDATAAQGEAVELLAASRALASALFSEGGPDAAPLPVVVDRMRFSLEKVAERMGLVGSQLRLLADAMEFPFGLAPVRELVAHASTRTAQALSSAEDARTLLSLYRAAGGFDGAKTYLLLLENSMELRPTGGFIGSVATVRVEDGRAEPPVVRDVYELDGQLKGHVEPPPPIKNLLQQEHWYLRDSNWDPDFAESAERAAWFYWKESGQTVDGVIAVTTNVLTDLLGVTGPIDLSDYNDRITKENFFGKSLFYTKADFFPGSTQKKDFLGSLATAVLQRLTSGSQAEVGGLASVILAALRAGEIQLWFAHPQPQAIAEGAGWAGRMAPIALVESNMGVNKVNAFITRSIQSQLVIGEDGAVGGTIAVTYRNASTGEEALSGGGTYLNYLRAYLPPDALISSVTVDGEEASHEEDPTDGSVRTGFALTVPPGATRTAVITYRRGEPIAFSGTRARLAVTFRKQPGVRDASLDFSIRYPAGWKGAGAHEAFATEGELRYNTVLDETKTFDVTFTK